MDTETEKYTTINLRNDTKELFFKKMEEEKESRKSKGILGNLTQDDFLKILLSR